MPGINSSRHQLPYLVVTQAQKELTHNEAIAMIDALLHPAVQDRLSTPPLVTMADIGKCWLVDVDGAGEWQNKTDQIAVWVGGSWRFLEPTPAMRVRNLADGTDMVWDGTQWIVAPTVANPQSGATIDVEAREAITAYIKVRARFLPSIERGQRFLFPSRSAEGHLTRRRVAQLMKDLAIKAGIDPKKLSPHVLRHAFASHLVAHGALYQSQGHALAQAVDLAPGVWRHAGQVDRAVHAQEKVLVFFNRRVDVRLRLHDGRCAGAEAILRRAFKRAAQWLPGRVGAQAALLARGQGLAQVEHPLRGADPARCAGRRGAVA